jgi:hypothetical protein
MSKSKPKVDHVKALMDEGLAIPALWDRDTLESSCEVEFTDKQWFVFIEDLFNLWYTEDLARELDSVMRSICEQWLEWHTKSGKEITKKLKELIKREGHLAGG